MKLLVAYLSAKIALTMQAPVPHKPTLERLHYVRYIVQRKLGGNANRASVRNVRPIDIARFIGHLMRTADCTHDPDKKKRIESICELIVKDCAGV